MDYKQLLKTHILNAATFIRATFSGRQRGQDLAWRKVVARPVRIKGQRHLQVSHFDAQQDITKNYAGDEVEAKVEALLALPFRNIHVHSTETHIEVQISKKGQAFVRQRAAATPALPSLEHDQHKKFLLPADKSDPFLQAIGMLTPQGQIKANMQRKFRQINEFLRLMMESNALDNITQRPLRLVDCGCGSAHLTFAAYHLLNHLRGIATRAVGIDVKVDLIGKQTRLAQALGWDSLTFEVARIRDYVPDAPPDIVLALHACDTATDEALAQAIRWHSQMIFSAPCCHHHLQAQMSQQPTPPVFKSVMRHGILKERLGDILTDSFRAQILRIHGYRTDVIEFISAEHTDKNLMIRAVKTSTQRNAQALREYEELKAYWQVKPYLEQLVGDTM